MFKDPDPEGRKNVQVHLLVQDNVNTTLLHTGYRISKAQSGTQSYNAESSDIKIKFMAESSDSKFIGLV